MIATAKKFEQDDKIQLEKLKAKNVFEEICGQTLKTTKSNDVKVKVNDMLSYFKSNDKELSKEEILKLIDNLKL